MAFIKVKEYDSDREALISVANIMLVEQEEIRPGELVARINLAQSRDFLTQNLYSDVVATIGYVVQSGQILEVTQSTYRPSIEAAQMSNYHPNDPS